MDRLNCAALANRFNGTALFAGTLAVAFSAGCAGESVTPFQGNRQEPFRELSVEAYCALEDGRVKNTTTIDTHEEGDVWVVQGGGCVDRNIVEVWAVLNNRDLMVWSEIDESSSSDLEPEPGIPIAYSMHYLVSKIIDVSWDMDWFHALNAGSFDAPEEVVVNYQKVNGTDYIPRWKGSMVLKPVTENVTAFAMVDEMEAAQSDEEESYGTLEDVLRKLRNGGANWDAIRVAEARAAEGQ